MAIVINGSGTVTGISVGGLPDDIVDAGTLADNAVGLAQMAAGTDGNIITYDTSGNPAVVATGSSGQVLTSAGADAVPTMATLSAGKILQFKSGQQQTEYSFSIETWHDVLLLTQTITPSSTSSKIYVHVTMNTATTESGSGAIYAHGRVLRDSTPIGLGNSAGNAQQQVGWSMSNRHGYTRIMPSTWAYLDSPSSTSALTYKVQIWGSEIQTINRSGENNSHATVGRCSCSFTVMEIGA